MMNQPLSSEDIKKAMRDRVSVKYDGIVYKCITAYIYRMVDDPHTRGFKGILQVELLDRSGSVVIASPDKIELMEQEWPYQ